MQTAMREMYDKQQNRLKLSQAPKRSDDGTYSTNARNNTHHHKELPPDNTSSLDTSNDDY